MSLLGSLRPKKGATHKKRRVGRGRSCGQGGTAGKGHKGQKARAGAPIPRGFEGGQTPLARRLPKFGFTNAKFKTTYQVVNLKDLNNLSGDVTPEALEAAGIVRKGKVKVLGDGKLEKALTVKAHKFSKTAQSAIEAAGGKVEVI
ncbi:MAG: 50S ribosomal protein L15 [Bdellovibrionaceae bacterium]|nr:50S ribosomal protein L15 [Pseudobdellovibrionaceae bacterium]|tara:strand:+ start:41871 stop:42305 length:435 start_codon:yes stop_codon:yes gene_type:complete